MTEVPGSWMQELALQWSCTEEQSSSRMHTHSWELLKAASLCSSHRNPKTAAQGPWPAFASASTHLLVHQSVVSGYCSPWLLILRPCGGFRNSTAQSHSFQVLSIYWPHFLHTGAHCHWLFLITWPLVVHKPEHYQENSKKQEKQPCFFYS